MNLIGHILVVTTVQRIKKTTVKRFPVLRNLTSESGLSKNIPSVIKQKGESQNGYFKKKKRAKFPVKGTFLTP